VKIVYFGTADFAVPALREVAPHVVLVVSQPDRPTGRGMKMQPSPVKTAALELGLPVETPGKARDPEFVDSVRELAADFLLVAAYGQILSVALLEAANQGGINLHGSILPHYRGAAPIQRCLQNGDRETGVTLMQMDKGMDSGDMIAIERLPIAPDETYGELAARLGDLAGQMAGSWAERLANGDYPRTPQNHDEATYAPKVTKEEAELKFDEPVELAYNDCRAFTPSPGAWLQTKVGRLRIGSARKLDTSGEPGVLLASDVLAFQGGSLQLLEVQPEGKKRMSGRDFFNGYRLSIGESLRP
jgi:methionyl-tRNA formyltransferase